MRWVGTRFSAGRDPRFDIEVADVSGDLAYSVGYERAEVSVDGGPMRPWKLRVTHIYRREDDQWKVVHRHADLAPEDQSPAG
jgi:ketosteroid isomerase-like protein